MINMKKISTYITILMAAVLTACNEDFNEGVASPQSYQQEETADKIVFSATGVGPINLGTIESPILTIATFTAPAVDGVTSIAYRLTLDNRVSVAVDEQGQVSKEKLQDAVVKLHGIRPVERTMKAVLTALITMDKTVYSASSDEFELKATPEAPVIESAYYLQGSLTQDQPIAFANSSGDPYANSVFTITVPSLTTDENGAQDAYFLVTSNSGLSLGAAQADNDALEGDLIMSQTAYPIKVSGGNYGSVKIAIDMMEGTYKIEKQTEAPYLWVPGNHQGWSPSNASILYKLTDDNRYWGFAALNGGFKLTAQPYWPNGQNGGIDYGYDYFTTKEGIGNDGGNLQLPQGLYFLKVNVNDYWIEATPIESLDIIGSAVGGWDAGKALTYDETEQCWELQTEMTAGEFKLRVNSTWNPDNSLGGTLDAPRPFAGGNITLDVAGQYTIKLYLNGRLVLIKE